MSNHNVTVSPDVNFTQVEMKPVFLSSSDKILRLPVFTLLIHTTHLTQFNTVMAAYKFVLNVKLVQFQHLLIDAWTWMLH